MVTAELFNELHIGFTPHSADFWTPKATYLFRTLLEIGLTFDGDLLEGYLEACWETEDGNWTGWRVNEKNPLYCDRWFIIQGLDDEIGEPTYYLIWQYIEKGACIYAQTPQRVMLGEEGEWEFFDK